MTPLKWQNITAAFHKVLDEPSRSLLHLLEKEMTALPTMYFFVSVRQLTSWSIKFENCNHLVNVFFTNSLLNHVFNFSTVCRRARGIGISFTARGFALLETVLSCWKSENVNALSGETWKTRRHRFMRRTAALRTTIIGNGHVWSRGLELNRVRSIVDP